MPRFSVFRWFFLGCCGLPLLCASRPLLADSAPSAPSVHLSSAAITVDYPKNNSIFPPEITPPTFLWRDASAQAVAWRIDVRFADRSAPLHLDSSGPGLQIGPIDPRCVSSSNRPPALTEEQAAAHTWIPEVEQWTRIKQHSSGHAATVTIAGLDSAGKVVSQGRVVFSTSTDPVAAPIFYRDVPLMPSAGAKNVVQPLAPSQLYLINWRLRDIAQPQSKLLMHDLHTCANCHSFSADGKTMGMDVDGPENDKGLYALVPVRPHMEIRTEDLIHWNADEKIGTSRVGFMSQVSPDGQAVLTTIAGHDQDIQSSYFVTNFQDYRFLQVFFPTRGILAWYDRKTGIRQPLPGADDPRYVQTDGVWSPDGKYIVFSRAEAREAHPANLPPATHANDPNEVQIQYDLYRIPFNNGKGGVAEPIRGASRNGMSNSFPKISPDGRWLVFVQARNAQLMRPDSQLYIVPVAGGVARRMRCNTALMNSWHSFSPNGHWLVFSSKSRSPYTQMFLTHIDSQGNDSPPIYIDNSTASNRAVNIPEFVNTAPGGIEEIDSSASHIYQLIDEAVQAQGKGDGAAALADWKEALRIDPDDPRANNGMGVLLGASGRLRASIPYFQKAIAQDADFFEAYVNLAAVLAREDQLPEAIDDWQHAVRLRPRYYKGQGSLGYAYYVQGKYPEALQHLRLALDGEPERVRLLEMTATLLATCPETSLRNGSEAVQLASKALQLSGENDALALDTLSVAYAEAGNFEQALAGEDRALTLPLKSEQSDWKAVLQAHRQSFVAHLPVREKLSSIAYPLPF